jgi:hypothetical protein
MIDANKVLPDLGNATKKNNSLVISKRSIALS